ncbi:MAG: hypothetical protein E2586_22305, partial [Novosphingobium sp.]|nr:hypothetical protein [Novosphingobium sp.]
MNRGEVESAGARIPEIGKHHGQAARRTLEIARNPQFSGNPGPAIHPPNYNDNGAPMAGPTPQAGTGIQMLDFLNNWRLPKKLWAAFSIINIIIAVVGINGFFATRELNSIAQQHVERGLAGMSRLADLISDVKELRIVVYSYYNANSAEDAAKLRDRLKEGEDKLIGSVNAYAEVAGDDFKADVDQMRERAVALNKINDHIFETRTKGDFDGAMGLIKNEGKVASHDMIAQTEGLIEKSRQRSKIAAEAGAHTADVAIYLSATLAIVGMGLIVFIWLLINRTVAAPMSRIADVTTTLAEGGRADVPYRERHDEI